MKTLFLFFLNLYSIVFSKIVRILFGSGCKFLPTCSEYSKEAIFRYGVLFGTILSIKRIIRCNPLSKGGFDPVPNKK